MQERREVTVSSDADRAASISGVLPSLVFGCKETVMMIEYDSYCDDDRGLIKSIVDRGYCENCDNIGGAVAKRHR